MPDNKEELEEELEKHRSSKKRFEEQGIELIRQFKNTDPTAVSGSPDFIKRLAIVDEMEDVSKEAWEHRVRIQEIVAALAQMELKEQSTEVLEEIRNHTRATKNAVEQGRRQTAVMTWCTVAIAVMTVAILYATFNTPAPNPIPPVQNSMYGEN